MELVRMDDGVRLRAMTGGSATAAPPVILVHGGPGLWDYLEPVSRLIADQTLVHRFDQRGCGGSDASGEQSMSRLVADIDRLRRHWAHPRVVLIGHSFGATLALAYAAAHPAETAAVGYLSGVGIGDWRTVYRAECMRRMTPQQRRRQADLAAAEVRDRDEEEEFRALSWFTDHFDREHAWHWAVADAKSPYRINYEANRVLNREVKAWDDAELVGAARALRMPVALIHGDGDPRPASSVIALADELPGASLRIVSGAGHHIWREKPDVLRRELSTLIRSA